MGDMSDNIKNSIDDQGGLCGSPWAYLGESGDLVEILSSIMSECGKRAVEARDLLYLREPDARSHEKGVRRHLRKSIRRRGGIRALRADVWRLVVETMGPLGNADSRNRPLRTEEEEDA